MKKKRVAVCAVSQRRNESDLWYERFQGMLLDLLEDLRKQAGFHFEEEGGVDMVVSCSDDIFDARTISDGGVTDVLGAHFRAEEKIAQEGLNAVAYGASVILSGHADLVLVMGHCKESQGESRNRITNLGFDPFYGRAVGLDFTNTCALQARQYMASSNVSDRDLAGVVARARRCGRNWNRTSCTCLAGYSGCGTCPVMCDCTGWISTCRTRWRPRGGSSRPHRRRRSGSATA